MIARTLIATAVGIAALSGTATPAPEAPPTTGTLTVFSESVSNVVTAEPVPTSERLTTLHTGDVLTLASPDPISATWGEVWNIVLEDGRTGFISVKAAIPTDATSKSDLVEPSMIVRPSAGTGWVGEAAAGSSTPYAYAHTLSAKVAPALAIGTTIDCAPWEVSGTAGILGEVYFTPCLVNGTLSYVRSEWVAPFDATDIDYSGTAEAAGETPVYDSLVVDDETTPAAIIPAGVTVETAMPIGGYTPVRYKDETGFVETKILTGEKSLSDKIKEKASEVWGSVKETAGDAKDKLGEKLDEVEKPQVVTTALDLPNLVLSLVLVVLTLGLAWVRKVSIFKLSKSVRRGLNVAAIVPLLVLASIAPIASFSWVLWIVLAVTGTVSLGVFSGFSPDVTKTATVARTRTAQVVTGASVISGALLGALVTGFAGWLAPLSAAIVALAAAAGYLLSAPAEKDEAPVTPDVPADAPTIDETTEEVSA